MVVSLLPEPGFLAKNQLPWQAPEWISVPGIAHLNPSEAERMLCPVRQLKLYLRDSERIRGGCLSIGTATSEISWEVISADGSWRQSRKLTQELRGSTTKLQHMRSELCQHHGLITVSLRVLEVVRSLPEFLSTRHGLYRWWDVYAGSSGGCTTSRRSRTSSPTFIVYTICMQPLLQCS